MPSKLLKLYAIMDESEQYYTSQEPHYLGGKAHWSYSKAHTWSNRSGATLKQRHLGKGRVVELTAARTIEGS